MVCSESIWVNTCRKRSHILKFKQLNSTFVPYHQKPHMREKLSYCLLVFFRADVSLFQNTKPFSLLIFEFASCCWGVVLLYEVGWTMFWLESSVAVLWFGFTWGQDALTGKQTCHSRPVSCQQKSETVLLIQCITGLIYTWQYPVVRRPPWMLRPVKMLVSVTLRIDKWGVVVHRLGLCCTQVKLWAAFLHSSGRNEVMTTGSCMQSRIPPHLCLKEELAALVSCLKNWCAGSNFIFKVLVGSAGVWRWV